MLDPALVSALSAAKYLPVPEMQAAIAEPDRIADAVLDVLGRAGDEPELEEAEANLLFWACTCWPPSGTRGRSAPSCDCCTGTARRSMASSVTS